MESSRSRSATRLELIALNRRGPYGPMQAAARLYRTARGREKTLYGDEGAASGTWPDWGDRLRDVKAAPVTAAELRAAEQEVSRAHQAGARVMTWFDEDYPANLRVAISAPPVLYVRGIFEPDAANDARAAAIVGSRKATPDYRSFTTDLSRRLSRGGITVVSGLAKGIDAAAHRGALDGGGRTIAVLAHGLHTVYPADHRRLARDIVDGGGALVSFFPWDVPPKRFHFPARNWVIAGLCLAAVIVQGAMTSGAMITANAAAVMGREVLAVPGLVTHPWSAGPHALLRDGAAPACHEDDVFAALGVKPADQDQMPLDFDRRELSDPLVKSMAGKLQAGPVALHELIELTGADVSQLLSTLTRLEMEGIVERYEDGTYAFSRTDRR